jgi:hypothetical protein
MTNVQTIRDQQATTILDGIDGLVTSRDALTIARTSTGTIVVRVHRLGETISVHRGTSVRDALAQLLTSQTA